MSAPDAIIWCGPRICDTLSAQTRRSCEVGESPVILRHFLLRGLTPSLATRLPEGSASEPSPTLCQRHASPAKFEQVTASHADRGSQFLHILSGELREQRHLVVSVLCERGGELREPGACQPRCDHRVLDGQGRVHWYAAFAASSIGRLSDPTRPAPSSRPHGAPGCQRHHSIVGALW